MLFSPVRQQVCIWFSPLLLLKALEIQNYSHFLRNLSSIFNFSNYFHIHFFAIEQTNRWKQISIRFNSRQMVFSIFLQLNENWSKFTCKPLLLIKNSSIFCGFIVEKKVETCNERKYYKMWNSMKCILESSVQLAHSNHSTTEKISSLLLGHFFGFCLCCCSSYWTVNYQSCFFFIFFISSRFSSVVRIASIISFDKLCYNSMLYISRSFVIVSFSLPMSQIFVCFVHYVTWKNRSGKKLNEWNWRGEGK